MVRITVFPDLVGNLREYILIERAVFKKKVIGAKSSTVESVSLSVQKFG